MEQPTESPCARWTDIAQVAMDQVTLMQSVRLRDGEPEEQLPQVEQQDAPESPESAAAAPGCQP